MARYPRRTVLHLSGTTLTAALAGCSGGESTNDPDAGTDSYGITVKNSLDESFDVSVYAKPIDGDPVFDRTVTVEPEEPKSFDEVLTEDGMTQVKAEILGVHHVFDDRYKLGSNYVDVGGENAPEVADVVVEVYPEEVPNYPENPVVAVRVLVGDVPPGQ